MTFGNKIRNLREDLDMSQSEVADMIPMNQSNYSKIERDLQEPDLFQLKRIAEIFRISADQLLDIEFKEDNTKDLVFARKVIDIYKDIYKK